MYRGGEKEKEYETLIPNINQPQTLNQAAITLSYQKGVLSCELTGIQHTHTHKELQVTHTGCSEVTI